MDYEKLGAFYLGRLYDFDARKTREELLLYDSKDLTTHAVVVGMTGSGKTGLGISLLEEAAIDGIPAIAVDPKGDLGNLLLTFPNLSASEFRPWIDEGEATRAAMKPDQYAAHVAKTWREGLSAWGQPAERVERFANSVERTIYTPGSDAGRSLTVLRSLDAPAEALRQDAEAYRESVSATASGLLALVGVDADPLQSREHILLTNLLDHAWQSGRSLSLPDLIRGLQSPPFDRVGVFDLETFYPADDRVELSLRLNNLLASPSFAGWMQGDPLDVGRLFYTAEGRPRLSIISIAHLGEAERMFFVTVLLGELLSWVRSQPGTSSLRAVFYMDEIFGYFPPVAKPPSKGPMLTLLKQARAYGLGVVLATQNPADLDYKGLANTGTWFLGRLQTERDKARVLDGLEGASTQAGQAFDRQEIDTLLSGLGKRVFLMNNVHENEPVLFQTRWVLSYLRGPLTREQIRRLTADDTADNSPAEPVAASVAAPTSTSERPIVPPDVREAFITAEKPLATGERLLYRPGLLGRAKLHFVRSTYNVDAWRETVLFCEVEGELPLDPWANARSLAVEKLQLSDRPEPDATFADLPAEFLRETKYRSWEKQLKEHLYRNESLTIWKCAELKLYSEPGQTAGEFRVRLSQAARERRDLEVEKLRKKYAGKLETLQKRVQTAERAVERETGQYQRAKTNSWLSIGSTILGALFGRKLASRGNISRAGTSARAATRAADQKGDIARAEEKVAELQEDIQAVQAEADEEIHRLQKSYELDALELEELSVSPRKSDLEIEQVALAWRPWAVDANGTTRPLSTDWRSR